MMEIASIVGTRPQFIKLAPFSREIRKRYREILIDTGQHYDRDMVNPFFSELVIPKPDYSLGIGAGSHGEQTSRMFQGLENILEAEQPELVVVFGDTNSTLAGALVASKMNIPVAHIEAGLRSYDRTMPEEINRVLTDHISTLLFCPTRASCKNLKREGITEGVHVVGDVMVDTLQHSKKAAMKHSTILERLDLKPKNYQLLTVHRPVNTDIKDNLATILQAVGDSHIHTAFPVHPRTAKMIREHKLRGMIPSNVVTTKPLGHMDITCLESNAKRILTDSGGIQKEAYLLGTPCITLRTNTEWMETVRAGWNILVGADRKKILRAIRKSQSPRRRPDVFGPPGASARIVAKIDSYISRR